MAEMNSSSAPLIIFVFCLLLIVTIFTGFQAFRADHIGPYLRVFGGFTAAKVIYSILLLSLAAILVAEVARVWWVDKVRLGTIQYLELDSEAKDGDGGMALRIVEQHAELVRKFGIAGPKDDDPERRFTPRTEQPIERAASLLDEIEITVQEVSVTGILSRLRRWVREPKEIGGNVTQTKDGFRATIRLPEAQYALADGRTHGQSMHFDDLDDLDAASFDVACGLIWLEAAQQQREIAAADMKGFCDWTRHWTTYLRLERRFLRDGALSEADAKAATDMHVALGTAIAAGTAFPKHWSLRADIVDLMSSEDRATRLRDQQADDLTYIAKLGIDDKERLRGDGTVTPEERLRALAFTRPALILRDGEIDDGELDAVNLLWQRVLRLAQSRQFVGKAAGATGLFRLVLPASGTAQAITYPPALGFAVGPGLIATPTFNLLPPPLNSKEPNAVVEVPQEFDASFVFADAWPADGVDAIRRHRIKRIFYLGSPSTQQMAFFDIEGHDATRFPPLALDLDAATGLRQRDQVVALGYPDRDTDTPAIFLDALFASGEGSVKRAMPGLVVNVPAANAPPTLSPQNAIIIDASTTGATAESRVIDVGSPTFDLTTGALVGLGLQGSWKDESDGKFTYVAPLAWLFTGGTLAATLQEKGAEVTFDEVVAAAGQPSTQVTAAMVLERAALPVTPPSDPQTKVPTAGGTGYDPQFLGETVALPTLRWPGPFKTLPYPHFSIVMDQQRRMAALTATNIDGARLLNLPRTLDIWRPDPRYDVTKQPMNGLFNGNRLDRGSLVRRSDVSWGTSPEANRAAQATFVLTNATPQLDEFNQRTWAQLEDMLLVHLERRQRRGVIFAGPVLSAEDKPFRGFRIPGAYWKVLIEKDGDTLRAAAFVLRQDVAVTGDGIIAGRAAPFDPVNSRLPLKRLEVIAGIDLGALRELPELQFN